MNWVNVGMAVASSALLIGGTGCQTEYRSDSKQLDSLWTNGAYEEAAHAAYRDAREESPHRKNRVLYFLEAGRAAQAAGDFRSSAEAFDHAFVDTFPYLAESPDATVSEAIVTTVGNDTMSIYRGTPNDRIMLHALNSLNYMAMGDMDTARVELNRAMLWQEDAHHRYARAIELATKRNADSVRDATDEWQDDGDDGWSSNSASVMNGNTSQIMNKHYANLPNKAAYANYGNPFASHLDGVFRLTTHRYGGDLPAARTGLRSVASMVPELVPIVGDDIVLASGSSGKLEPTTWVYFFTGQTPEYEEVRITMPLAISGGFTMPTLALPKLVPNTDMVPRLDVRTDEAGSSQSHLLTNTGDVASWQFKERLPIIISQEAIRATGKAVAAYAATRFASQQQNLAASLLALGTVIYQVSSAQADLRCWHTLPAEIQVARIPTPPSGRLYLSTPDGRDLGTADVAAGQSNILVVSMPSNAAVAPSLMPIQLTGEREPWVASFDLHAVPEDESIEGDQADTVMLAATDADDTPDSKQAPIDSHETIDAPPSMPTAVPEADLAQHTRTSVDEPVDWEEASDAPQVDVGPLHEYTMVEQEVEAPQFTASPMLAFAAVDTADESVQSPPPLPVASPPVPNHRFPVKGVTLTWGQDMQWAPKVDHLLDARVTLQPTPSGYMAHYGGDAPLVTSPAALLRNRPVWMHQDALVAMSDAVSRVLSDSGYMGTRVYPALASPDTFGHSTLHFVVFLPVDSLDATAHWPEGLAAVEHPTLPSVSGASAKALHPPARGQPDNGFAAESSDQPVSIAIDVDTMEAIPPSTPLFEKRPAPRAFKPMPQLPTGPHAVDAITAIWGRSMDWYPDLNAMLDVPVRLRADRTGYHAHTGRGPVVVSTPGLLVARQPAALHPDAMHAMSRALQGQLEDHGFIGTTVHPACTSPDARGFVELHLVVFMPIENAGADDIWPAHLTRVPLPPAPKTAAPAKKAPSS